MNTIKPQPNQSSLDVVLTACGTMEGTMQLMFANGCSVTAAVSEEYAIPDTIATDAATMTYMRSNNILPGTKGSE